MHFGHRVGKIGPWGLVLNYPISFVPGSVRCSPALCLLYYISFQNDEDENINADYPRLQWGNDLLLKFKRLERYIEK